MKKESIAVVGLGRFGGTLAKTISQLGHEVLGVDMREEIVQQLSPYLTQAVIADFSDEVAIRALELQSFDTVVLAVGDEFETKLLAAMVLKEMNVPFVVAKATSEMEGKLLKKIGVDLVIYPEADMATRLAHMLVRDHVTDYFQLSKDVCIVEMSLPDFMKGKSLVDVNLREEFNVSVIAIKRDRLVIAPPNPREALAAEDRIIVLGTDQAITKLTKK